MSARWSHTLSPPAVEKLGLTRSCDMPLPVGLDPPAASESEIMKPAGLEVSYHLFEFGIQETFIVEYPDRLLHQELDGECIALVVSESSTVVNQVETLDKRVGIFFAEDDEDLPFPAREVPDPLLAGRDRIGEVE